MYPRQYYAHQDTKATRYSDRQKSLIHKLLSKLKALISSRGRRGTVVISAPIRVETSAPACLSPRRPLIRPVDHKTGRINDRMGTHAIITKLPFGRVSKPTSPPSAGSFGCIDDRQLQAHLRRGVIGYEFSPKAPIPSIITTGPLYCNSPTAPQFHDASPRKEMWCYSCRKRFATDERTGLCRKCMLSSSLTTYYPRRLIRG